MKVNLLGYGVYLPRYRIKREEIGRAWGGGGRGENTVAFVNEDVITMGIEAALNALHHSGLDPSRLDALYLGTASSPYIEQSSLGVIAAAVGARAGIDAMDFAATPRAGTAAVKAAMDAIASGRIGKALVIAADCRQPAPGSDLELSFGAGAAAFILGAEPGLAEMEDVFTFTTPFRDTYRSTDDPFVHLFEPRYSREFGYSHHIAQAAKGLLGRLGAAIGSYQHVILHQTDERTPRAAGRSLSASPAQMEAGSLFPQVGDCGASAPLLSMAAALDRAKAGERLLALSYGSGASDALSLRITASVGERLRPLSAYLQSKEYVDYTTYLKTRGVLRDPSPPAKMGLPPMSPLISRELAELLRPLGARCLKCGYMNFPPSERKICIRCGNTTFELAVLPHRGKIHTFCISYYLPSGFDESPLPVIIADLEDGTRHRALGTEMKPEEVKIDKVVELVVRRLATEENVNLYGNVFRFPRLAAS